MKACDRIRRAKAVLFFVLLILAAADFVSADEVRLEGNYTLSGNGDVALSIKLTPPMTIYQQLRENVSNLYLVMRQFSSSRADTEVVDKKADWDDSNRSLTFSLKMLGACRNLGNRWELDVPKGTEFINLDESKRTLYFNESVPDSSEITIRGTSKLLMPAEAGNIKYDDTRRVISYTMPPVKTHGGVSGLMVLAAVLATMGVVLTAASFFLK
jgi:hypothetical protein